MALNLKWTKSNKNMISGSLLPLNAPIMMCFCHIARRSVNDALSTPFIICNTVASGSLYHNKIN